MRLIAAWTGVALFYLAAILAIVVAIWFFARMVGGDVRLAQRVTQRPAQIWSLWALDSALATFGIGLAVTCLDSPPLVPLGLAFIGASLGLATFGVSLLRRR